MTNIASISDENLKILRKDFEGDIYTDIPTRLMYATDASVYREVPIAVTRPKHSNDIKQLIHFASENQLSLIPRTAGTSLAGQVVGKGIVVDVSKYMNKVLEINAEEKWVRVQPAVVLDELNLILEDKGLFFGPETSTSNRCMIGGMVGNNACGAHSLIYGSTRDHTIALKTILSDGSEVEFGPLSTEAFNEKTLGDTLENRIYKNISEFLSDTENQEEIRQQYPEKSLKRRNTGYAIDLLLETAPFGVDEIPFNLCKLIAGSEGTLAFITEIKLNLVPLPPKVKGLVCVHFETLEEALKGNLIALKHHPVAIELMDHVIIECTRENLSQRENRFFIEGDPGAILIIEFARESREEINELASKLEKDLRDQNYGYHFPVVFGDDIKKIWALRKAGLGLLSNIPGDAKPVAVIEDTAVNPEVLPQYIEEFQKLLETYGLSCVYYAHIATGELHLRPVLNLKTKKDTDLFYTLAHETAKLVKKYKGSLSGEHGDGRLRGEFIPLMLGEKNYKLIKSIKNTWDPDQIFNPGKIVDTPPMNSSLRYTPGKLQREIDTIFDFTAKQGILRATEQCNGSGDCRKSELIGGVMCPSYMALKDENATTRARANILREFLTNSSKSNPFDHKEIYDVMDLCLSCKGCKSECPSSVDITKYKAEFLQHYYLSNGIPLRTRLIANITTLNKLGMLWPAIFNFFISIKLISGIFKRMLGFAPKRSIPKIYKLTLKTWIRKNNKQADILGEKGKVFLFADEFTNYNDVEIGIKAIKLLNSLGYEVEIPRHKLSGRTYLSKGLLKKAQKLANANVELLKDIVNEQHPLIGIEPSGILTFRDEYKELVKKELREPAKQLSRNVYSIDEFLCSEIEKANIKVDSFTSEERKISLHGHCYQKALTSTAPTVKMLSFPENYHVDEIKSGCCGMAGSFGYEKEHYDLSMKVGELVLFPSIKETDKEVIIAAPGTSCRHQIMDGTGRKALHPVEILYGALKNSWDDS